MKSSFVRTALVSTVVLALLAAFPVALAAEEAASSPAPLRAGTVVEKSDAGAFSYLKAVDGEGKQFWVLTAICTIGENGSVEVLDGAHYDKIESKDLGTVLEDVYTARRLKLNGLEVKGFSAHGLPAGCILLK